MSSPSGARRSCTIDLTLDLAAPRASRHLLGLLLAQWGVAHGEVVDCAGLVVSELVTHVLTQSQVDGAVTVGVELGDEDLRLWVLDRSPAVPSQRSPHPGADGRGLVVVGRLATRWGVEPHDGGLRSYADLALSPVTCC